MDDKLLISYLLGESTEEQNKVLLDWINADAENLREFSRIKTLYGYCSSFRTDDSGYSKAFDRLNKAIDSKAGKGRKGFRAWGLAASVGAALALAIILVSPIGSKQGVKHYTVFNPDSLSMIVKLPDQSTVWLSKDSHISYSDNYPENRVVTLEGEAYFDITKDAANPFLLKTPSMSIRVLGTFFKVRAFSNENCSRTVLAEGSVVLIDNKGENIINLSPGQEALYSDADGFLQVVDVDTDAMAMMKYGVVSLDNLSIKDIINRIEQIYGVSLSVDTNSHQDSLYTVNFLKNAPVSRVVDAIEVVLGRHITISNK